MLVANNKDGKRVYANSGTHYKDVFCPMCGEPVTHKMGSLMAHHFAHKKESACPYGKEKDNKSPWHIHMQELFPPESLERRFYDKETGKIKHIADVFLEVSNTVIEFQHSPISAEDFKDRSLFHINDGRRIIWIFDESKEGSELGRFREDEYGDGMEWPRSPRKMISETIKNQELEIFNNFSICVYLGGEGDVVHRIVKQQVNYKYVQFSVHPISIHADMDINDFFRRESFWYSQSPLKELIEEAKRAERERKKIEQEKWNRQRPIVVKPRPVRKFHF